jgi:hypothetical protein
VRLAYAASERGIEYDYECAGGRISLHVRADRSAVRFHVMLPEGATATAVRIEGESLPFENLRVEASPYADFEAEIRGEAGIEITFG